MRPIRVVVTCTHRKRQAVPSSLRLRRVTGVRTSTRLRAWTERLTTTSVPATRAIDLYAGEHWDVARRLAKLSDADTTVDLWVCSAGYGLIPSSAPLHPYAATFTPGNADSVPAGPEGATAWWNALAGWDGPSTGPRSIADLVAADPDSRVLVALSATYLRACGDDVARALEKTRGSGQVSVISVGTKQTPELADALLPGDARLQAALGGSRQALNVRLAEHLLTSGVIDHDDMAEALAKLLVDQPAIPRYDRQAATDAEVRRYIRERLRTDPSATHTRLLRQFRGDQRACEQSRFAALFRAETRMPL